MGAVEILFIIIIIIIIIIILEGEHLSALGSHPSRGDLKFCVSIIYHISGVYVGGGGGGGGRKTCVRECVFFRQYLKAVFLVLSMFVSNALLCS